MEILSEPDKTPGVGGGDGMPAVGGGGGNGKLGIDLGDDVYNALQPAQPAASNMLQIHKRRVNTKVTHLNNFIESTSK